MDIKTLSFSDAKSRGLLKPLSVLLFSGDEWVSDTIKLVTDIEDTKHGETKKYSTWSHCGCIINQDILPLGKNMVADELYTYELTCSGYIANDTTPDVQTGKPKFGVQIRNLQSVLHTYKGDVAVLNLLHNPMDRTSTETQEAYLERQDMLR